MHSGCRMERKRESERDSRVCVVQLFERENEMKEEKKQFCARCEEKKRWREDGGRAENELCFITPSLAGRWNSML